MRTTTNKMEYYAQSKFSSDMINLKKIIIDYSLPIILSMYLVSSIGNQYQDLNIENLAEMPHILTINPSRTLENKFN
jgi:hypothetical protein